MEVKLLLLLPPPPQPPVRVVTLVIWTFCDTMLSSNSFARLSSNNPRCLNLFFSNLEPVTLSLPSSSPQIPISSFNSSARTPTTTFLCLLVHRPSLSQRKSEMLLRG